MFGKEDRCDDGDWPVRRLKSGGYKAGPDFTSGMVDAFAT